MQKAQGDIASHARTESDVSVGGGETTLADGDGDDASTRGMRSPGGSAVASPVTPIGEISVNGNGNANVSENGIPTIRISTESDRDEGKEEKDGEAAVKAAAVDALERPVQAATEDEGQEIDHDAPPKKEPPSPTQQEPFSFSNKRLCERWLDNLFMVLYEVC